MSQAIGVRILDPTFVRCMTLGELLILSVPQLPPLENGIIVLVYGESRCYFIFLSISIYIYIYHT